MRSTPGALVGGHVAFLLSLHLLFAPVAGGEASLRPEKDPPRAFPGPATPWEEPGASPESSLAATASPAGAGSPPGTFSVAAFEADLFTGAATAHIPIVVPAGAAGVAPKLALRYNSSTVDELGPRDQGQGTGLGWTLDLGGFVLRDTKNTTPTSDDTFKLVFGGVAHDLVLIDAAQSIYHTRDETFLKVQYAASSDSWTLTTKDGTRHRFGFNTDSRAITRGLDLTTPIAYKYLLDQVTTTSGVAVQYAYTKQTATIASNGRTYDQAVYPAAITWAYVGGTAVGAARQVLFTYAPRSDWTDTSGTTVMSFFERDRLDTVEVRVGGALVRKYVLGVDYSIDRDPAYSWGGGATGDLTLRTVTVYGADGVSTLPALAFSYTSSRLSSAGNGIGGSVAYAYERVTATAPLYNACLVPLMSNDEFPTVLGCQTWGAAWSPDPWGFSTLSGAAVATSVLGPQTLYHGCLVPTTDEWGMVVGCGLYGVRGSPDPWGFSMYNLRGYAGTANPIGTRALYWACLTPIRDWYGEVVGCSWYGGTWSPDPWGYASLLGYIHVGSFDRYRVTSRTLADGRGGTSTLTFAYAGPGLSADGKEFRGHASVRAVDPVGHYADTWFKQDDLMKGRPYQGQSRSSGGALLAATTGAWEATAPYPGVTFVRLVRTDATTCDDRGTACKTTGQSFEYDAWGNPTRVYSWGDLAVVGDERDEYTDWAVDVTAWLHRPKRTALHDAAGVVLRERWLFYDGLGWGGLGARGLLTREERRLAGGLGAAGNPVVTSAWDAYGNRTTVTDARSCATTTTYESSQTYPASIRTCLGHTTTFAFDARWGVRMSETDPNNQMTTYYYDVHGRFFGVANPLDVNSTWGTLAHLYLDFGNPAAQRILTVWTVEHNTEKILWREDYFDGLGRTYLTRSLGPGYQSIYSETTYDARGLVATLSAPHFSSEAAVLTQFTYDARGRQIQALYPDGTSVRTSYAPGLVTTTDQRGNVKRRYQDANGRLVRGEEVNGGETYATTYAHDAAGALLRTTNHLGHVTTLAYDLLGRKTSMNDPNMGRWTYGYDLGGNLVSQTDAGGQAVTFTYDPQGRALTKSYPGGAKIQWTYDDPSVAYSRGRLTRIADLATVTTFTYDVLGRTTQTQRLLDGTTYTMSQTYNALGSVTSQTFPDGETVGYAYNQAGWLASVPGYVTSITYNARGQQTKAQYANGVTTTWTYHATTFRPTTRVTAGGSGQLQNLAYAYDAAGNLIQITDALFTGSRTFAYDALGRLASANGAFGVAQGQVAEIYRYDAVGNLLEKAGALYAYSDPLHPAAVTSRSDGPGYTYDANGNMLTGAGRTLAWSADNRLAAVTIQGGNSATFAYDAAGIRVRKTTAAGVTRYPFPGYEIDPYGVVTKTVGGVAKKSSGTALSYHNDHLGGVHVITDATGARVQLVEYDPWGKVSRSEGTADPTHRFTGQELDPETGLYYYKGRYYDALLARFVSADPFVPAPGNPQALNRYSYVLNSPPNYVDPTGYFFDKIFKTIFKFKLEAGKVLTPIVAGVAVGIVGGVAVTAATDNPAAGFYAGIIAGAAASGAVGAAINGSDVGQSVMLSVVFAAVLAPAGPPLANALGGGLDGAVVAGAILGGVGGGVSAAIAGGGWGDILQSQALGSVTGAVGAAIAYAGYQPLASETQGAATLETDMTIRIIARAVTTNGIPVPGHHLSFEFPDAWLMEMGPDAEGNIKLFQGTLARGGLLRATADALESGSFISKLTSVNSAMLYKLIADYHALMSGRPYQWFSNNSNYFVNSVISGAGGNPSIQGVFAPAFSWGAGPMRLAPLPIVP